MTEQNKTPLTAQPGSAPAPEQKPAEKRPAEKPLRRVGSLTLGACLIAAGAFFLLYFFVPGFDVQLTLKIAPAVALVLLGCEVLFFAARPGRWKYDFVSVLVCLVLMAGCFCMAMLPLLWDELSGENQQTMNRLSAQAIDELYTACKQDAQDIAIRDISGRLYLSGPQAETLQQAAALPAGDTCLTLTVELFGPYDSAAAFARDCYTLTALAKQCTVPPEKLHFTWDARSLAESSLNTGSLLYTEDYSLDLSGAVQLDWTEQQMEQQNVRYVDLFKTLSDHEEQLYYRRDSHWNMRGAQLAAQTLLKELKGSEAEFDSCINGKTSPHTGDLYEMVYPAGNETEQDTAYDFTYQYDEKFHSADDITIHTENSAADESIFVYRDSFGINLHPFLAQSYGNACFSRNMPYLLTAVTEEHPDVLLVELVERNLNWLLERAPEMPAPERTAVPAADTGTSAKAQRKDSRMEETFCLTGDLSGQRVDDDSPIYILAETGTYEASPCGEGTQPFTAYLPQNVREQQLKAAFLSDGEWVFCALAD